MEAPTEREQAYAEAVLAFIREADASYPDRVRAWEAAMEKVHRSFPESEAIAVYARGLGAARTGDTAEAGQAYERLEELEAASLEAWGNDYWPRQIQVKRGGISAWVALAEGRVDEAVGEMRRTAALADDLEKSPVTPGDLQPAHELLGDLLMEVDQPADALEACEVSLAKWPGRYHTLLGAARAAEATGDGDP